MRGWVVQAALSAWALSACGQQELATPVQTYLAFAKGAQRGDVGKAYALLSSATQKSLAQRTKEISSTSGGAIKDNPAALFFETLSSAQPLTEVKLLEQGPQGALLRVQAGGQSAQVSLVKEPQGWRIDVPEAWRG